MKQLTTQELNETVWQTIGRLGTAIKYDYPKERLLALYEKITEDIQTGNTDIEHVNEDLSDNQGKSLSKEFAGN